MWPKCISNSVASIAQFVSFLLQGLLMGHLPWERLRALLGRLQWVALPSRHTSLPTQVIDRCGVSSLLLLTRNPTRVSLRRTRSCALCTLLLLVDASSMLSR